VNSKEPTLIYMQSKYEYNGTQRVMISTGDKIHPSDWDAIKKRAITNKKNPANTDINLWLDKMDNTFKSVFRNCLIDGITPSAEVVKLKIETLLNITPTTSGNQRMTLYSFIENFIQESKSLKSVNTIWKIIDQVKHQLQVPLKF
jgi:hypothetical protein